MRTVFGGNTNATVGNDMVHSPLTWSSTIYMLIKLPLGVISFTLALVLPIVSTATLLMPAVYLVNLFINAILLKNGIHSTSYIIPYFIKVHSTFDGFMFLKTFVGVPVGLLLLYITRLVLNAVALGSAELVHAMLSEDERAMPVQPHPMMMAQCQE